MKENYFKTFFFTTIIILLIISIYLAIRNKDSYAINKEDINKEKVISFDINLGITKYDILDPIISKNQDIQYLSKIIYDPIINISEDFKLKEGLAEEWNKQDNKTYLIKLKEDIFFSDGEKFTSNDILYTIDYIRKNDSIYNDNVKNIDNIEMINDYLIKIFLKEPEDYFEYMLTFPIISSKSNTGTGKFVIDKITDEELILKSKIKNQQIFVKIYDSSKDLYNAFLEGNIDLFTTSNENYEKYIGKVGHNKSIIIGRKFDYLKINLNKKLFKNKEIIQALSLLINKNEINKKIYNGLYNVAEFPLQYGSFLYNKNIKYEYEINKAQRILEDTGWKYNR